MAGEDNRGGDGDGAGEQEDSPRRRIPRPRGRLQVGSVVSTLVGLTGLLSWLGLHPGSASGNPRAAQLSPTAVATVAKTPEVTLPVVSFPVVTIPVEVHPVLRMSPTSGPVGSDVTVSASGFPAGVEVDITLQAYNLATVHTDQSGKFTTTARIPEFFRGLPGRYPMEATQRDSTNSTEEYFTVTD